MSLFNLLKPTVVPKDMSAKDVVNMYKSEAYHKSPLLKPTVVPKGMPAQDVVNMYKSEGANARVGPFKPTVVPRGGQGGQHPMPPGGRGGYTSEKEKWKEGFRPPGGRGGAGGFRPPPSSPLSMEPPDRTMAGTVGGMDASPAAPQGISSGDSSPAAPTAGDGGGRYMEAGPLFGKLSDIFSAAGGGAGGLGTPKRPPVRRGVTHRNSKAIRSSSAVRGLG
jgi:hypothetical protein